MAYEKIIAPTPKELFITQMVRKILSGELAAGEKLPNERALAEMMDINRSVVHAGLEEMQRMGFVAIESRRGNFVADYKQDGSFYTLAAIARYSEGNFDDSMRISFVELRNSIVGGAMIRLAKTGTKDDFAALRAMLEKHKRQEALDNDIKTAARHLIEFNMELTHRSGNSMYELILNTFAEKNLVIWERCVEYWGLDSVVKQEEIIIDMLEREKGHDAAMYLENMFETYMLENNLKRR